MKLLDYLELKKLTATEFATEVGMAPQTIWNALKGYEMSLSNALKIEEYTRSWVRCIDLMPTKKRKSYKNKSTLANIMNTQSDNHSDNHSHECPQQRFGG